MGAKTALLAFTDGDLRPRLLRPVRTNPAELVRVLHPGYEVTPIEDDDLGENTYPPYDTSYVAVLEGAELFCDRRLVFDPPSRLPARVLEAAAGRRVIMHGMHSVSDWLGFAVWENGDLVRSLSLSPDGGGGDNIGTPYEFELPFWAGERPVKAPYPLPFHPLVLGQAALRAFFGFVNEGRPSPDDINPFEVALHGFRVADPTGREQAEREAALQEFLRKVGPPRQYKV
ncbi:DUF6928 family protein [Paractinoplanes lichenicola]|uniref:Uncharacterized protein n=1 Tax=Paractinoplanes lichenicola TaxID=2802976 RepID=A0ABS1W010_9ACTN|nr:hypothetical protein [Actinoplanes lichenicola]MBL7260023.1 hypothetical protein [Actinoplanes lichenicola]